MGIKGRLDHPGWPKQWLNSYPSSQNHGSVENGMSPIVVSFHLGDPFPPEP